jgi:hypothetical protein
MKSGNRVIRILLEAVLALACLSAVAVRAQHFSEDQITVTSSPEHKLSGIKVYGMKLQQVIDIYGKPTAQEKDKQGLPLYIWKKGAIKLQVGTAYDNPENVYSVEVWGSKPLGVLGKTSKGLTLGCNLDCVKRIYRPKLIQPSPSEAIIAFNDDTRLQVGLDASGHVNHISLVGAVE